jgi:hypothetical protein
MGSFENTLDRMKALYTYGKDLNENKTINSYTIEHKAEAADGRTYGIIRECNKYYIKVAQTGKETLAEGYSYIGGFCNKGNYEYDSYNKALKNFELKMSSINEACEGNVVISTLDPFKKGDFLMEATDKMKDEIARQRQIMHNVSMLLNEGSEIGASRKDDVVMYDGKNPEAKNGKRGDEDMKDTKAKPEYAGSKTNGVDKKVAPFDNEPGKCADQLKEGCDCAEGNCECDWGTEGIGKGRDPKQVGWEMEGQQTVNEEENDWGSKGLPSTPGVGEADTDHNNGPFTQNVNEEEDFGDAEDVEASDEENDDFDFGSDAEDFEVEDFDSEEGEEMPMDDEEMPMDDEEMPEESDDDIMARIAELEAELAALKAEVGGEEDIDVELSMDDEEMPMDDEEMPMDDEEMPMDGEVSDFETDFNDVDDSEFEGEESFDSEMDECGDMSLMEAKKAYMQSIVESVTAKILNEDELHVFGKHPGYQKKPMELPTTGEDKNQWGEDWNDESVYSEEAFGTKIGSSAPFDKLVDTITKDVMSQLSGDAFKKKVR